MFYMNEDQIDSALREQLRSALDDAIAGLDLARKGPFIRTAMYAMRYRHLQSKQRADPLKSLLDFFKAARRSFSFEGLLYNDASSLTRRLQREIDTLRQHRFYPYLRLAFAKLDDDLTALAGAALRIKTSPTQNDSLPVDPRLLDINGAAWASVKALKGSRDATTVVVPVYNGRARTLACLHSVLTARNETSARLIVINDHSPDQQLRDELQRLASSGRFDLINQPVNCGFVSSVNAGILASSGDVILLNSDTVVCDRWLDHLHASAQAREDVASVSPLSNNATVLSYPHINSDNPMPRDSSLRALCGYLEEQVEDNAIIEIPTPVGFCMYMRRHVIEQIGIFDEATFGIGYGEEGDWAMRARRKGYRHFVTTRSFVYHVGGVSFGEQAAK